MYYHCSPTGGLTRLEPGKPQNFDKPSLVYMTTSLPMALMYGIRNFEYTYGYTADGRIYYEEYFPDALRHLYGGKTAYLYICKPLTTEKTIIPNEAVSSAAVEVTEQILIPDVLEALLEQERLGTLQIRRYEELPPKTREWIFRAELEEIRKRKLLHTHSAMAAYMKCHYPAVWEYACKEEMNPPED